MITQLTAENVKKLQAVTITPDGSPVLLTGENEAGKSTVLDCIWIALTGQTPDQPIRNGAKKARIELTVRIDGEETPLVIERRFTGKGSYITVKEQDGTKRSSPQALLDGLTSTLTLDPLAFSRMKPKDQRETLLKLSGLDLTKWETRYKEAYEARKEANREAKTRQAGVEGYPTEFPEDLPNDEQSATDLLAEIEEMQAKRQAQKDAEKERIEISDRISGCEEKIEYLEEQLKQYKASLIKHKEALDEHEIPGAPDEEDITAKRQELATIEQTNKQVRVKIGKADAQKRANEANKAATAADQKVKALENEKEDLIANADFGIEGISIDDDGVLFEGQPLDQQSSARTIEISARIAMRGDPRFKVLIIRDASLIGTKIFQRIAQMAEEKGYQLWVERFQEQPGEHGVHIIDGAIAYIDGQATGKQEAPEDATTLDEDDSIDI